jgi:organic hydroperoxide reductase OsmC/OhrA
MPRRHTYRTTLDWTGNLGSGTSDYRGYSRDHMFTAGVKPPIPGSSDPAFRGDPARWNPEELLVASLSACHQLWFLHLASEAGLVVTTYRDEAEGVMVEGSDGGGAFERVTLHPAVTLAVQHGPDDAVRAEALHHRAHELCFIARSLNFAVLCEPVQAVFG